MKSNKTIREEAVSPRSSNYQYKLVEISCPLGDNNDATTNTMDTSKALFIQKDQLLLELNDTALNYVKAEIDLLPESMFKSMILLHLQGLTQQEIGDALHMNQSTVFKNMRGKSNRHYMQKLQLSLMANEEFLDVIDKMNDIDDGPMPIQKVVNSWDRKD